MKVDKVRGHLFDGRVVTFRRVSVVPGIGNDDCSLGEVTDHAAEAGVVLFPPEERVLDHQRRLTVAL